MYDPMSEDSRTWGMASHLSALAGYVVPFGNILGPLVVWLAKGKEDPYVDEQGKEALNFQISWTIWIVIAAVFSFILIGLPFLIGLAVADFILMIIAGVAARDGRHYRYPLTVRFIH
jgi:uncharacterized Tic20 family protein